MWSGSVSHGIITEIEKLAEDVEIKKAEQGLTDSAYVSDYRKSKVGWLNPKDEKNAADNALAACPFLAKGKPSITVACAETEPGTPIKTAGKVSEVATTDNSPIIIAIPETGSIPKTNGSNNDNPTVPPNPGITPTTKPIKTPRIKKKIEGPETIVANAANNASNICLLYTSDAADE